MKYILYFLFYLCSAVVKLIEKKKIEYNPKQNRKKKGNKMITKILETIV